ncbi:HAD-superfamily hydrolase, subfamily IIB/mannosyl-3-phosphoglycerate phosphatase family [Hoeflea phototrophica DFL-43]|uniref:HAD-superfamily hydrolase, subfamily IIB/mannosyl-3-phosphoglycerate phosphatase family n=1 Tax=Hoeflea phototrophica (strain DSM 17068 / NCIMB 14078 / DFL-43) TaxID=411684 RepID=A9CZC8_HOEPD|nr:HAD-IIB family hydrolase [Hoeflea phototrophica]EDQ34746.1 HAD-superfamily hydrolase, subfamily IIB/mannosyl-3-phosphoglycerate phosphatase family [Hoeflea phototrophica DFL-43]
MPLDNKLTRSAMPAIRHDRLIVFTDLDGTLLDHETYSHAAAGAALAALKSHGVPLVLASSKTASEIAPLRAELGFEHCQAIVENGAGILEAHQTGDGSDQVHQRLLDALVELPPALRSCFEGFSDWSDEEVASRTHLPLDQARMAKQRQFSEPGLWSGGETERDQFKALLKKRGITALQGGRFMTLSFGSDKAQRMIDIIARHSSPGYKPFAVALGDAGNDIKMLESADLGFIIPNSSHGGIGQLAGEASGRIIRETAEGPAGWNHAVLGLLKTSSNT